MPYKREESRDERRGVRVEREESIGEEKRRESRRERITRDEAEESLKRYEKTVYSIRAVREQERELKRTRDFICLYIYIICLFTYIYICCVYSYILFVGISDYTTSNDTMSHPHSTGRT
jgi:hypothetical protein